MNKIRPSEKEIIAGIKSAGRYSARVATEGEARRLLKKAMPDAVELPRADTGKVYPKSPQVCRKWYQVHPPEPAVNHLRWHFKYEDWTEGKKGSGGRWGHIEFGEQVGEV